MTPPSSGRAKQAPGPWGVSLLSFVVSWLRAAAWLFASFGAGASSRSPRYILSSVVRSFHRERLRLDLVYKRKVGT
ncbi:hypothetical protein ACMD2_07299 [Ananas comosus]|uniref:Uncharacterized protein n=1 Tax=Ananas comosus TaxID=4615 RepID=A0A199VL46_ANACO|nr:hypothetical protein ACMD2_07299 [Ananas comosus]